MFAMGKPRRPPFPCQLHLTDIGYYTEMGIGCSANLEEAKKWYSRSASLRFPKALERLEDLRKGGNRAGRPAARLSRRDQKKDETECVVM